MASGGVWAGVARIMSQGSKRTPSEIQELLSGNQAASEAAIPAQRAGPGVRGLDDELGDNFSRDNTVDSEDFLIDELERVAKEKGVPLDTVLEQFDDVLNARALSNSRQTTDAAQMDLPLTREFPEAERTLEELGLPNTATGVGTENFVTSQGATTEFPRVIGSQAGVSSPNAKSSLDEVSVNPTEQQIHGIIEKTDVPGLGSIGHVPDEAQDLIFLQQSLTRRLKDFGDALGQPSNTKKREGVGGQVKDKLNEWKTRQADAVEAKDAEALRGIIDEFDGVVESGSRHGDIEAGAQNYFTNDARKRELARNKSKPTIGIKDSQITRSKAQQKAFDRANDLRDTQNIGRPRTKRGLKQVNTNEFGRTPRQEPTPPDTIQEAPFDSRTRDAKGRSRLKEALGRIGKANVPPERKKESHLLKGLRSLREDEQTILDASKRGKPKNKVFGKDDSRKNDGPRFPKQQPRPDPVHPPIHSVEEEIALIQARRAEARANPVRPEDLSPKRQLADQEARKQLDAADANKANRMSEDEDLGGIFSEKLFGDSPEQTRFMSNPRSVAILKRVDEKLAKVTEAAPASERDIIEMLNIERNTMLREGDVMGLENFIQQMDDLSDGLRNIQAGRKDL